MEPGLAFTLCGLEICFLIPAFILGFINRSKRILVHIYHILSHRRGAKIEIRYNPDNPKKSYIPGYDTKVYKLLSIIFSVIGMIPILVCAIIFFAIN